MKRIGLMIALVAVVLVAALVVRSMITAPVVADTEHRVFTNKSIEGRWGFSAQGTILPPTLPDATPAAAVGTMNFDGSGGCSITDTENIGGFIIGPQTTETCVYSVNPDGTGTLSFTFPGDPEPGLVAFVMVNKREVFDIRADSVAVATAVWKKR